MQKGSVNVQSSVLHWGTAGAQCCMPCLTFPLLHRRTHIQAKKRLKDGNVFVPRFRLRMSDTVDAVRVVKSTGQRVRKSHALRLHDGGVLSSAEIQIHLPSLLSKTSPSASSIHRPLSLPLATCHIFKQELMNRIFKGWGERKWFDIPPLPLTPDADPALHASAAPSSSSRGTKR